jgi:hypothetical protein
MTLTTVPVKDVVSKEMGGKRRLYRSKEEKMKEAAEKRRLTILRTIDAFDEIEKQNRAREGKY